MSGMPAPSIPNLLSLRGSRGGSGTRGRTRGRGGAPAASASAPSHDAVIQGTDTDAAVSRMSAVDLGYIQDRYAQYFVPTSGTGDHVRRLPIINRGTYTRTTAINRLVDIFLDATEGQKRQIISLGAGTDTRVFRLFSETGRSKLIYHELDFPAITDNKFRLVSSVPALRRIILSSNVAAESRHWRGDNLPTENQYWGHYLDLRDVLKADFTDLEGVQTDIPTLLISECCLCYLETSEATSVIKYFTDRISSLSLVLYEPVHPDDPFGQQMVSNLASRHIRMPTLQDYRDIKQQESRLRASGFVSACSSTIEDIWRNWIPTEEKERLDALEGLDEVEEWDLLARHYCVSWGWRGMDIDGWKMGNA
ncbi:leucine carboxyl methyltransferase [Xylariaceae sp. FL1272]|nr:leucine carboxyl methyltransferase [Xylariaceae sp. FL1272]